MRATVFVRASASPTIAGSPYSYGGNCVRGERGLSHRSVSVAMGPPCLTLRTALRRCCAVRQAGPCLLLEPVRQNSDRVHPGRLARESLEIDRRLAAQCRERELLDPADDHRRDHPRVELADEAGSERLGEVALDDPDQRGIDLAEDLLDIDI